MSIRPRTRKAPAFTVVRATNYYPVADGWVWRQCVVRLADGTLDVLDIPSHRLGAAA